MVLILQFGGKMLEKPTSSKEIGWYRNSSKKQFGGYQLSINLLHYFSKKNSSLFSSSLFSVDGVSTSWTEGLTIFKFLYPILMLACWNEGTVSSRKL